MGRPPLDDPSTVMNDWSDRNDRGSRRTTRTSRRWGPN